MVEAGSGSAQAKYAFARLARANEDIERICRENSERAQPPEAFIITSESVSGALLGVSLEFLEKGQLLACPGLPLAGAAFNPDWGFPRAEINLHHDESADFGLPPGSLDALTHGNMFGYRLCPINNHEIPGVARQLAYIRAELAKPRQQHTRESRIKITATSI
jgi:hypothetical protein